MVSKSLQRSLSQANAEIVNYLFTIRSQHSLMRISRSTMHSDLLSLEAAVAVARSGFACIFSSSDEYERALITERRAQGHYAACSRNWLIVHRTGARSGESTIYWV